MLTPTTAMLLASALVAGIAWLLFRTQATQESHRRVAVALVAASMLLPAFLLALGVIDLRTSTLVGLLILTASVVEAGLVSRRGIPSYPLWPSRAWVVLWLALAVIHVLALLVGDWPYIPQYALFAGVGVLWWVRVDRHLVERGITPVWITFAGLMLLLLPTGILDGTGSGDAQEVINADSPYWNPVLSVLGLDTRWTGMFAHPNALGAFAAMGIGLALVRTQLSWPALGLSTILLLASSSRTAGIAALLGAVAYLAVHGKLRLRLGVVIAAALVGIVTIQSLATDSNVDTGTGRYEVWGSVPGLLGNDWLWGMGPEASTALVRRGLLPEWAARLHSVLFEHLLYSGVLGLSVVLLLLTVLAISALKERLSLPLLLVVLTLAIGDNYAHLFQMTFGVLGYVAVIATCTGGAPAERQPAGPRDADLTTKRVTSSDLRKPQHS